MLDLLGGLATAIGNVLVAIINAAIVALGAIIATVLSLFPSMGNAPSLGNSDGWLGWLNFFVPVGGLLAGLTVFVTLWIAMLAFRILARWVKAL